MAMMRTASATAGGENQEQQENQHQHHGDDGIVQPFSTRLPLANLPLLLTSALVFNAVAAPQLELSFAVRTKDLLVQHLDRSLQLLSALGTRDMQDLRILQLDGRTPASCRGTRGSGGRRPRRLDDGRERRSRMIGTWAGHRSAGRSPRLSSRWGLGWTWGRSVGRSGRGPSRIGGRRPRRPGSGRGGCGAVLRRQRMAGRSRRRRDGRHGRRDDERQPTDRALTGLSGLSRIGLQDIRALGTLKLKHVFYPDRFHEVARVPLTVTPGPCGN